MARYIPGWVDVARAQFADLPDDLQHQVDRRLSDLLDDPSGAGCFEDRVTSQWTTTDSGGAVIIVYTFRPGLPRLVILRLVY